MEKLPEDVLTSIIIGFPAKRIAQMRCISKKWNAFLSRASFIKSHLYHASHNVDEFLLVFSNSLFDESFTAHPTQSPHLNSQTLNLNNNSLIKLPVNSQTWRRDTPISLIGSVNGLICFCTHRRKKVYDLHIWNPSLSALLDLPSYKTPSPSHGYDNVFQFGFDPKTNDYKVIKIAFRLLKVKNLSGKFNLIKDYLQVEVYSMRKGSWKIIAQKFPSHVSLIRDENDFFVDRINGYLHWLCNTGDEHKQQTIVAFDLGAESFSQLFLPDSLLNNNVHRQDALGVSDSKLCVMSSFRYSVECEVWVMDTYGEAKSWVKRHVFSLCSDIINPYGLTLKKELLFKASDQNLYLFDPISGKVKSFMIKAGKCGQTKIVQYVESLVWVVPDKCGINMSTLQI